MTSPEINSREYWEDRFQQNWDAAGGPEQTLFFAEVAYGLMPEWLRRDLAAAPWTLADVGCAEGEAAAYFKRSLPDLRVTGLDFSEAAIDVAKGRYRDVAFEVADLNVFDREFDVAFCSNVLEHFVEPRPIMDRVARRTARHFIVVVPGWELPRHHEHHVTFDLRGFPINLGNLSLVHIEAVNCARIDAKQWPGYQIIAVYSSQQAIDELRLTAADLVAFASLPSLANDDIESLASFDSSLGVLRSRVNQARLDASLDGISSRLQGISDRQEAIGYNTRAELQDHFDSLVSSSVTRLSQAIDGRFAEFSPLVSAVQQSLHLAQGMESKLDAAAAEVRQLQDVHVRESEKTVALEKQLALLTETLAEERKCLEFARAREAELQAIADRSTRLLVDSAERGARTESRLLEVMRDLAVERERALSADAAVGESERQREMLARELAAMTSRAEDGDARLREADRQVEELRSARELLEAAVKDGRQREESLEQELRGWAERFSEVGALLEQSRRSEGELRIELKAKEEEMSAIEKAIQGLNAQLVLLTDEMRAQGDERDRDLSSLRAECDGLKSALSILEQDRQRFVLLAARYREQLLEMQSSASWRATSPLRAIKSAITGVDPVAPIEFLPSPLHVDLASLTPPAGVVARHRLSVATAPLPISAPAEWAPSGRDLSWEEFSAGVLSRRDEYRGVFVQELVIDWNVPLYQRPQHIASAMARLGFLVLYRTDNWGGDNVDGFREVAKDVWITNSAMTDGIEGAVRSIYSTAYAHQPQGFEARPKSSVLVYEYIDHIDPQISGEPENIARLVAMKEWAFGGGVDVIVASAKMLEAEAVAAAGSQKVILAQNGVDTRHYRNPAQQTVAVPQSLVEFRARFRTIVGYFGAIAPWLWYEAVRDLVAARPDVGFVFIGPDYYGGVDRLPIGENVLYMGTVDYKVLPGHARYFDVCFIPFEPGEIAKTTSPLKLFEYFALEKPVVVTSDMMECVAYPEVFRGRSASEFSSAIDAAVSVKDDVSFRQRLARLADENDWDRRAEAFSRAFTILSTKTQANGH